MNLSRQSKTLLSLDSSNDLRNSLYIKLYMHD